MRTCPKDEGKKEEQQEKRKKQSQNKPHCLQRTTSAMDGILEKIRALPDMRKLYDEILFERITTEWPHQLREKIVNGASSTTTRALDVLVVLVRYLT